jgi:hypothetical protein
MDTHNIDVGAKGRRWLEGMQTEFFRMCRETYHI